jgi:hypothetical protein
MHRADLEKLILISDYDSPALPVKAGDGLAGQLADAKIMIEALEAENVGLRAALQRVNPQV